MRAAFIRQTLAWTSGTAILLSTTGSPARADDAATTSPVAPPATQRAGDPDDGDQSLISTGRDDEYDGLIAHLGLSGEPLERFREKVVERRRSLEAFVESPNGKRYAALRAQIAKARNERRPDDVRRLRAEMAPLADEYWALRNAGRRSIIAALSPQDRRRAAGYALESRLRRALDPAKLTPDQVARLRSLADEAAAKWYTDDTLNADPFFRGLDAVAPGVARQATQTILTDEQRAALSARATASRPARSPATAPAGDGVPR